MDLMITLFIQVKPLWLDSGEAEMEARMEGWRGWGKGRKEGIRREGKIESRTEGRKERDKAGRKN